MNDPDQEAAKQQQQLERKVEKLTGDLIDALARIAKLEAALARVPIEWRNTINLKLDGA